MILLVAACLSPEERNGSGEFPDVAGPELVHEPPSGPVLAGDTVELRVTATDDEGVDGVDVVWRVEGGIAWERQELSPDGDDDWVVDLTAKAPGLEYAFEARDVSSYHATSRLPEQGVFSLEVVLATESAPYFEDFEGSQSSFSLYGLGWAEYSLGFAGARWVVSQREAASGAWTVRHPPGLEGQEIDDWLVSPALDLAGFGAAQLTWWQYGPSDPPETQPEGSIWVSTGARDPAVGDYEMLLEVPVVSEPGWTRSPVVDLSAFDGPVYLAWRVTGTGAPWPIDDVAVGALVADLVLVDVDVNGAEPGSTATVVLTLENRAADTDGALVVGGSISADLGAFGAQKDVGVLAGGTAVTVDLPLSIDADAPDNSLATLTLTASDASQSWEWDVDFVIGHPSTAHVELEVDALGLVQAFLGAGDPEAPEVEVPLVQSILDVGLWTYEADITAYGSLLPPSTGDRRWWVRVEATEVGRVGTFAITWDEATYTTDDLAEFELSTSVYSFLPPRPRPTVTASIPDPDPVRPGDVVSWQIEVANEGGDTVGETTALLVTSDPDALVLTTDPAELASDGWAHGSTATLAFEVEILASQADDRPVSFELQVTDENETTTTPVVLPVPWAVLVPTSVDIDDWASGNGNGVADDGETVELEVALTNIGSIDTGNGLVCELAPRDAFATLPADEDDYGFLAAGATRDEDDYVLAVDGAAAGDPLLLDLLCTDDDGRTYPGLVDLVVGESPWTWLSRVPDSNVDAASGYPFDIVHGRHRVVGDTLQLELTSETAYDPATLFVEAWFESTGSPYEWYQLVAQSGTGTLRGYDQVTPWVNLHPDPVVTDVDPYTVRIDVDIPAMDLAVDELSIGFAAGFCPATYYCDQYPDGWGDPYQSGFEEDLWVGVSW